MRNFHILTHYIMSKIYAKCFSTKEDKVKGNILLVANFSSDVGYAWWLMENFWINIANKFKVNKNKIVLIYPKIKTIPESISKAPLLIIEHNYSDHSRKNMKKLKRIVKEHNIKNIYLTDQQYWGSIYLRLRLWSVKKIVMHDHMPGERSALTWYKKVIKKVIHLPRIFSCNHYIGVSEFVKRRFIETACIPSYKCSCILNGIKPINSDSISKDFLIKNFSIHSDTFVVASCARASLYKSIDTLIKCADVIINQLKIKNICFLHIGDGPDILFYKNMARQYRLEKKFYFLGKRNDVRKILPLCHFGVQTSKGEAFSLAILEYMSAGLVTIVPDHCGNPEAIKHGVNGYLYKPGHFRYIVKILCELIYNDKKREKIGKAAKETIEKYFSVERTNKELTDLLDREFY